MDINGLENLYIRIDVHISRIITGLTHLVIYIIIRQGILYAGFQRITNTYNNFYIVNIEYNYLAYK